MNTYIIQLQLDAYPLYPTTKSSEKLTMSTNTGDLSEVRFLIREPGSLLERGCKPEEERKKGKEGQKHVAMLKFDDPSDSGLGSQLLAQSG